MDILIIYEYGPNKFDVCCCCCRTMLLCWRDEWQHTHTETHVYTYIVWNAESAMKISYQYIPNRFGCQLNRAIEKYFVLLEIPASARQTKHHHFLPLWSREDSAKQILQLEQPSVIFIHYFLNNRGFEKIVHLRGQGSHKSTRWLFTSPRPVVHAMRDTKRLDEFR